VAQVVVYPVGIIHKRGRRKRALSLPCPAAGSSTCRISDQDSLSAFVRLKPPSKRRLACANLLADVEQKVNHVDVWNMVDVGIYKGSTDVSCDASCRSDAEPCVILEQIHDTFLGLYYD